MLKWIRTQNRSDFGPWGAHSFPSNHILLLQRPTRLVTVPNYSHQETSAGHSGWKLKTFHSAYRIHRINNFVTRNRLPFSFVILTEQFYSFLLLPVQRIQSPVWRYYTYLEFPSLMSFLLVSMCVVTIHRRLFYLNPVVVEFKTSWDLCFLVMRF